jgi:translation initiation factor IF-3
VPNVRVIGADGSALGVLETQEALRQARELNLDLVEVAPNSRPPVVRIMDFGAYRYRQQKQASQQRKNAKKVEVKGVRIGMRISEHDFEHKVNQTKKFLAEGHRIKLELVMRGREQAFALRSRAFEKIDQFITSLGVPVIREQEPAKVGNRLTLVLAPGRAAPATPAAPPTPNKP